MNDTSLTIKDIAKLAGVSIGTVDRVLHDRGNVSQKSLEKVKEVLEKYDYKPCAAAQALSDRGRRIVIGVTYPNIECAFWNEVIIGIEHAIRRLTPFGAKIVVRTSPNYDPEGQKEAILQLLEEGVKGIIIGAVENFSLKAVDAFIPESIPFATVINRITSPRALFHVGPDDMKSGELAALLLNLYSEGKTMNSVIISSNGQFVGSQLRIAGFISKATQEFRNINITQTILAEGATDNDIDREIYLKVSETLKKYPNTNALYIMNGILKGAVEAVRDAGRDDINIVGHEIIPELNEYLRKGFVKASIYQHPAKQMCAAIQLMYSYLADGILDNRNYITELSIIMKETYSFIQMGESDFLGQY